MNYKKVILVLSALFAITNGLIGQSIYDRPEELKKIIEEKDALFWKAYNSCDITNMANMFTNDVEFYHDKNGLTEGLERLKESLSTGLCENGSSIQREAKEGTVEIFPMNGIGAIISGEHYFVENDQKVGVAKFNHLWVFKDKEWKMSRVLSYDHRPASSDIEAIHLDDNQLKRFLGIYEGQQTGRVEITPSDDGLLLKATGFQFNLFAKNKDTFFIKERNITFQFVEGKGGKFEKIVVRENGDLAEELSRTN